MARLTFKKGAKIQRWEEKLASPQAALKMIGVLAQADSQQAFKSQRFGRKKWAARAPINIYGIIADFAAGKDKPAARRFDSRPALVDTGRLRSSIAFKVSGRKVTIGSSLDYAAVLNEGGPIESEKLTERVQQAISEWLDGQNEGMQIALGWLTNPDLRDTTLKGEVEARPFVGITKELIRDVRQVVGVEIMEAR